MKKIKTLIVDDSIFIRVMLRKILETKSSHFEVIGFATNGLEAVECVKNNPDIDLITMDVNMPNMNGLEAVKEVLKLQDIPIVMISSTTKKGADETIKALQYGAVDFITKAELELQNVFSNIEDEIILKLKAAANANLKPTINIVKKDKTVTFEENFGKIIGIACSTGGPNALKVLMSGIKQNFLHPIIVAQHMPEGGYSESLAKNLDEISSSKVKIAENNEQIKGGVVYICPGGYNISIKEKEGLYFIEMNKEKEGYYMPSADLMFKSLSGLKRVEKVAVVLTGMGNDGLEGCISLESVGGEIILESAKTAIVYGMPKKVMESKLVCNKVELDLDKIANKLNLI